MTRQEFIDLLEREGTGVFSFCRMLAGSKEEAEELYQETMLMATERLSYIDCTKNPKSFLISLCVGIYKNNRKKAAAQKIYKILVQQPLLFPVPIFIEKEIISKL